jgi:hypothetical protein
MTAFEIHLAQSVTGPNGEPLEVELCADLSADGEIYGLVQVVDRSCDDAGDGNLVSITYSPVPEWVLAQLDMGDLAEEVRLKLQARERGWP